MITINIVKVADDQICSFYYWKSQSFLCRVDAGLNINLRTLSSDSLFSSMCGTFFAMLLRGNTRGTSGFLNPSQSDFVIFKQNPIKLWYTARSHSGFWAGFSIVCPFSRSLCVSCCECLNLPAILPISDGKNCKHIETSTARDWAYGCASFYSWLTGKRLLTYIDCRNKGPIVPCWEGGGGKMGSMSVPRKSSPIARG